MITTHIASLAQSTELVYEQILKMKNMEQEKRDALLHYDLDVTESLMKKQQAMVMQLDNMEKKRLSHQVAAGFSNKTSSQILAAADEETQLLLKPLFEKLRIVADELKTLNQVSINIAKSELRLMEQKISSSEDGLYQSNGKKRGASLIGSSFQEKI